MNMRRVSILPSSRGAFFLPAYYNVAVMLADGQGTPKNIEASKEWVYRIQRGAQQPELRPRDQLGPAKGAWVVYAS